MSLSLIILLITLVLWALLLYYFFIVRRWHDWSYHARSGLVVLAFLLIPVVLTVLVDQHGAKDRLASHGIAIDPSLGSSVGVATGGLVAGRSWVFEYERPPRALLDFYRQSGNRPGWELVVDSEMLLILARDGERMSISGSDGTAVFQLSDADRD